MRRLLQIRRKTIVLACFVSLLVASCAALAVQRLSVLAATTPPQAAQQSSTTSYLAISEWGVKTPNGGSDTFTYNMSPDKDSVTLGTKKLASEDPQCASRGAGVIMRFAPTDYVSPYDTGPTVQQYAQQNPGVYDYVGGYYYLYEPSQAPCGSSTNDQNQASNEAKAMAKQLQSTSN